MDGFYVAKIQKLSDKRPEDNEEEEANEETVEEKVGDTSKEEIDWAAEVRRAVSKGKKEVRKNAVDAPTAETDSKKRPADDDDDDANVATKKAKGKKSHMSMPPKKGQKKKKNSTNAKVTKPRRRKVPVEM